MALPLPTEYKFGFVVGRAIHAIADTAKDLDSLPEARAAAGEFNFHPPLELRKSITDYSAFVAHGRFAAHLDKLGRIVDGPTYDKIQDGVLPGDDPDGPHGIWLITGTYQVTSKLDNGMTIPPFQVEVTEAHTPENPLDLVTAAPPQPGPGVTLMTVQVPAGGGPNETLVRDTNGNLTWSSVAYDAAQDAQAALAAIPSEVTTELGLQVPPAVSAELATQGIAVDTTAGTKVTIGGVVVFYDSGWRDFTSLLAPGSFVSGTLHVKRTLDKVHVRFNNLVLAQGSGLLPLLTGFPTLFAPPSADRSMYAIGTTVDATSAQVLAFYTTTLSWVRATSPTGVTTQTRPPGGLSGTFAWPCDRPIPTNFTGLGTPA